MTPSPGTLDDQLLESARRRLLTATDATDGRLFSAEHALVADTFTGTGQAVLGRLGSGLQRPGRAAWTATSTAPPPRSRPPAPPSNAAGPPRSAPSRWPTWPTSRSPRTGSTPRCTSPSTPACSPTRSPTRSRPGHCTRRTTGCPWPSPGSTWRSWPSRRRCRACGSPPRCPTSATGGRCCGCAPSSTPSWPRPCTAGVTRRAAGSWPTSPSAAPPPPASCPGSRRRSTATCWTSSRPGR